MNDFLDELGSVVLSNHEKFIHYRYFAPQSFEIIFTTDRITVQHGIWDPPSYFLKSEILTEGEFDPDCFINRIVTNLETVSEKDVFDGMIEDVKWLINGGNRLYVKKKK